MNCPLRLPKKEIFSFQLSWKLDTSAVGLTRTVIDLTGTPSHTHGNEQGNVQKSANTGGITGNTYSKYMERAADDAVIIETNIR